MQNFCGVNNSSNSAALAFATLKRLIYAPRFSEVTSEFGFAAEASKTTKCHKARLGANSIPTITQ